MFALKYSGMSSTLYNEVIQMFKQIAISIIGTVLTVVQPTIPRAHSS